MRLSTPPFDIGNPNQFGVHPCKICNNPTEPFDVTDFNKSCEIAHHDFANLAGIPVYYNLCVECEFLFTTFCDRWDADTFVRYIYNDEYLLVDPKCESDRPTEWAEHFITLLKPIGNPLLRVLDYGSGNGLMARLMTEQGINTVAYDPFYNPIRPQAMFDVITCTEVIEHTHDPAALLGDMCSLLKDDGMILFTTALIPPEILMIGARWWYAAPRNGHVSIFSLKSLMLLGAKFNLELHVGQVNDAAVKCFTRKSSANRR